MLELLFGWWRYRRVKHGDMLYLVWIFPTVLSVLATGAIVFSARPPSLLGEPSVSKIIFSIFAQLPGFFIAALAAVAALRNKFLDVTMPKPTPTIPIKIRTEIENQELTLRTFLLLSLGYLSALSLLILAASAIGTYAFDAKAVGEFTPQAPLYVILGAKFIAGVVYLYFPFSVLATSLHVVYFLSDGAHRAH